MADTGAKGRLAEIMQRTKVAPPTIPEVPADPGAPHFKVKILSPYRTYYQGDAVSLSAANRTGPFDILPGHVNFFSLVDGGKVIVDTGFQKLEFPIDQGVIRVNLAGVTLFANV